MARARSVSLSISAKQSEEIARWLCNRKLEQAKRWLTDVLDMKRAVPYTRRNRGIGHRPGIGPGSYPQNASKAFLTMLESAEANAQSKGLNTKELVIAHIAANNGGRRFHGGRHGGRLMKRSHIEVVVAEAAPETQVSK